MSDFDDAAPALKGYRLTTVHIYYHMPDHPHLLQEFIWQFFDLPPLFPRLHRFLLFWERKIEGPLHSVYVTCAEDTTGADGLWAVPRGVTLH